MEGRGGKGRGREREGARVIHTEEIISYCGQTIRGFVAVTIASVAKMFIVKTAQNDSA